MKASHFALPLALLIAMPSLAATRGFEVRDMVNLDRYSSPTLSPDGRRLVFAKRVLDGESGKASTSLWIEDLFARDAAPPQRLTPEGWTANSPAFSPAGTTEDFTRPTLAATRGFGVRDIVNLGRYSSPTLSPDGRRLVVAKRVLDGESGKASTSLLIEDLLGGDAAPPKRLTPEGWNVNSPAFSPDGTTVYFLSAKDDSSQLYSMPAAGGEPVKLTAFPVGVDGFKISPDGSRVAFSAGAFPDCKAGAGQGVLACTKAKLDEAEKSKATGMVFD